MRQTERSPCRVQDSHHVQVERGYLHMATLKIRTLVSEILHSARAPAVLVSACAVAALSPALGFAADAAPSAELDELVVTGIRGAIDQAISIKRNNDDVIEVISAEDIGKLPRSEERRVGKE